MVDVSYNTYLLVDDDDDDDDEEENDDLNREAIAASGLCIKEGMIRIETYLCVYQKYDACVLYIVTMEDDDDAHLLRADEIRVLLIIICDCIPACFLCIYHTPCLAPVQVDKG